VSPILVRPVREQLEHDRVIRLLQTKFRRRFDVGINPGAERNSPVGTGIATIYPDVVLVSQDRGKKVMAVIEVETVESVNNLEAMAEWIPFGRLKFPFHLYVPAAMVDVAKRLCSDSQIPVAEIHTYHWIGDEMRFLPIYKAPAPAARLASPRTKPASAKAAARPTSAKATARPGSAKATTRQAGARKKPAANAGKKTGKSPKRK
jgi:hypothetical protein